MPHLVFERADGSSHTVRGYKMSAPSPDVKRYQSKRLPGAQIPAKVDLRSYMTAVEDQKQTNSCVANAVAGAYEYLVKRHQEDEAYDVSRLFIYYNARRLEDPKNIEDEGSIVAKAIDGLHKFGACSEETWPFDEASVNEKPSDDAYSEAKEFLVEDYAAVPVDLDAWKTALAENNPIVFGIKLFGSFDKQRKKGFVSTPQPAEAGRGSHGGHAMLCVGYSDPDQLFIVRNSWGNDWGDAGYCYIPYDYMMNEDYNFGDSWTIHRLEEFPLDESTWAHDDESIVPDLELELANMSEEDFHAMHEACGKVPLETRIALIFLEAAAQDGEISEAELVALAEYLGTILEQLGSNMPADKVMRKAMNRASQEGLLEESIKILGAYFSNEMLAGVTSKVREVVGSDDVSEEEEAFINALVEAWQVGEGEDDSDGEESDDEESDDEEEPAESEDESEDDADEEEPAEGEEENGDEEEEGDEEEDE
jgi:C1A family cysteine protease